MGVMESLAPVTGIFSSGVSNLSSKVWILIPVVIISLFGFAIFMLKMLKGKKDQWTHQLKVRRVLQNGLMSEPIYHKMRRFPLIKKAEVFELEKPLLGGYLIPELDEYSGNNEFSIILDKNNRIYTNTGEYFDANKSSVNVSARHAEIDIQRANLKADFQNINKVSDRIQWATIAKYAFLGIMMIVIMIVSISAIGEWGDAKKAEAEQAQAMAQAMNNLATAMETVEATVNTQKLEILPMLKEIYNTKNIQPIINRELNINETS